MKAMSFNENNYSLNYLIWDQETNSSTSTFFCSVDDDKNYEKQFDANGAEKYEIGVTDFGW